MELFTRFKSKSLKARSVVTVGKRKNLITDRLFSVVEYRLMKVEWNRCVRYYVQLESETVLIAVDLWIYDM